MKRDSDKESLYCRRFHACGPRSKCFYVAISIMGQSPLWGNLHQARRPSRQRRRLYRGLRDAAPNIVGCEDTGRRSVGLVPAFNGILTSRWDSTEELDRLPSPMRGKAFLRIPFGLDVFELNQSRGCAISRPYLILCQSYSSSSLPSTRPVARLT
jgi:hypothetical protein